MPYYENRRNVIEPDIYAVEVQISISWTHNMIESSAQIWKPEANKQQILQT